MEHESSITSLSTIFLWEALFTSEEYSTRNTFWAYVHIQLKELEDGSAKKLGYHTLLCSLTQHTWLHLQVHTLSSSILNNLSADMPLGHYAIKVCSWNCLFSSSLFLMLLTAKLVIPWALILWSLVPTSFSYFSFHPHHLSILCSEQSRKHLPGTTRTTYLGSSCLHDRRFICLEPLNISWLVPATATTDCRLVVSYSILGWCPLFEFEPIVFCPEVNR